MSISVHVCGQEKTLRADNFRDSLNGLPLFCTEVRKLFGLNQIRFSIVSEDNCIISEFTDLEVFLDEPVSTFVLRIEFSITHPGDPSPETIFARDLLELTQQLKLSSKRLRDKQGSLIRNNSDLLATIQASRNLCELRIEDSRSRSPRPRSDIQDDPDDVDLFPSSKRPVSPPSNIIIPSHRPHQSSSSAIFGKYDPNTLQSEVGGDDDDDFKDFEMSSRRGRMRPTSDSSSVLVKLRKAKDLPGWLPTLPPMPNMESPERKEKDLSRPVSHELQGGSRECLICGCDESFDSFVRCAHTEHTKFAHLSCAGVVYAQNTWFCD